MLRHITGMGNTLLLANDEAEQLFNQVEGRTKIEKIESIYGDNEFGSGTWATVIWYTTVVTQEQQQAEKFEFIGSVGIDPTDPDWRIKWEEQQALIDASVASQEAPQSTETEK